MTETTAPFKKIAEKHVGVVELPGGAAKITVPAVGGAPSFNIYADGGVDDGAYYPPSHISVYGEPSVRKLRDLLTVALEKFSENAELNQTTRV